jgi:hypothetical protein
MEEFWKIKFSYTGRSNPSQSITGGCGPHTHTHISCSGGRRCLGVGGWERPHLSSRGLEPVPGGGYKERERAPGVSSVLIPQKQCVEAGQRGRLPVPVRQTDRQTDRWLPKLAGNVFKIKLHRSVQLIQLLHNKSSDSYPVLQFMLYYYGLPADHCLSLSPPFSVKNHIGQKKKILSRPKKQTTSLSLCLSSAFKNLWIAGYNFWWVSV